MPLIYKICEFVPKLMGFWIRFPYIKIILIFNYKINELKSILK